MRYQKGKQGESSLQRIEEANPKDATDDWMSAHCTPQSSTTSSRQRQKYEIKTEFYMNAALSYFQLGVIMSAPQKGKPFIPSEDKDILAFAEAYKDQTLAGISVWQLAERLGVKSHLCSLSSWPCRPSRVIENTTLYHLSNVEHVSISG